MTPNTLPSAFGNHKSDLFSHEFVVICCFYCCWFLVCFLASAYKWCHLSFLVWLFSLSIIILKVHPCCSHSRVSSFFNNTSLTESESEVAQSYPTLCGPMDYSLPGFSIRGIFQARVLEWVAISFSRGSSRPGDRTQVSRIAGRHFILWATREAQFNRLNWSRLKQNRTDLLFFRNCLIYRLEGARRGWQNFSPCKDWGRIPLPKMGRNLSRASGRMT